MAVSICPDCSRPLPSGSGGFCPYCMLRGGLETSEMETPGFDVMDTAHDLRAENLETSLMGRYKLGSKLGEGGFGVVFKAHQRLPIQREVAVKILRSQVNATPIIARFEAERQALALIDHPGVSHVLDVGETEDGRPFFVMERVEGVPVTTYVRQAKPRLAERLRLFTAICEAVHHAHQKGVVHRDLKPANILVNVEDGVARPKVIDFGLAKALEARALGRHLIYTLHDQIIGTPGYVSPEQAEHGSAVADVRGDVFALGALLYEMLTGVPVVDQKSLIGKPIDEALRSVTQQPFVPPSARDSSLRGDLDAIVRKALSADPTQRYASADALAADVQRYREGWPVAARKPGWFYLTGKLIRRHPWSMTAGGALLIVLGVFAWSGIQKYQQQERERVLEQQHEAKRRHDNSRKFFRDARLLSEGGSHGDAIAHLAYALREDPQNSIAVTYLAALLAQSYPGHRSAVEPVLKSGWKRALDVAISSASRTAVVLCAAEDSARADMIMRWKLDPGNDPTKGVNELGLPDGLKMTAASISEDNDFLILGFGDGSLARYEMGSGMFTQFDSKMSASIHLLALSGDGTHVLAVTEGGEVRLWDVGELAPAAPAHSLGQGIEHVALDETAQVAVVSQGRSITVLSPRYGAVLVPSKAMPEGFVSELAVNPSGTLVAAALKNSRILVMSLPTLSPLGSPLVATAPVTAMDFDAEGEVLVTGDSRGVVMTWSAREMRPLDAGMKLNGSIRLCRVMDDPPLTLAMSERGDLRLWQPDGQIVSAHQGQPFVGLCAAAQDGSLTLSMPTKEGRIEIWEMYAHMLQPRAWNQPVPELAEALSVSRSGDPGLTLRGAQYTYTSDLDRRVLITNNVSGHRTGGELDHDSPVHHLALTPDGRRLITITADGTHRVWDALTAEPLMPPFRGSESATRVQPLADGRGYLYRRESGEWMQLPLPLQQQEAPAWFMDFAEACAGQSLQADGTSKVISRDRQGEIVGSVDAADQSPLAQLVRWLMKRTDERAAWPE